MTEPLYGFLLMVGVYLLVRYMQEGGWSFPVAAGIVLGAAYLTRQEAQFLCLLFLIVLLACRRGIALRVRIARAAILSLVFIMTILPYAVLLNRKMGRWTAGSKASVNLSSPLIWDEGLAREEYVYSLDQSGTERRIDAIGRENALTILWRQRRTIASRYFPNLSRGAAHTPFLFVSPLLLILVPLGLFERIWRRGNRAIEILLLLIGVFPFVLYAIFRIELRYLIPFLPLYLLWGARGCEVFLGWLRVNISPKPLLSMIALFIILMSLVPYTVRRYRLFARSQPVEYREIGRWIAEHGGEGARVLAPSGWSVSYYAGNPLATYIPWTTPEGLLRFAAHHRFEYLVLDERYIDSARPQLRPLLGEIRYPGLEPIRSFTGSTGGTITLYHFDPPR
jgi:4-amino-4-deoxy-L-arabinose transferase-like glycosyltransferase